MSSRFVIVISYYISGSLPDDPKTLREFAARQLARTDPVPYNTLDWLLSYNSLGPDDTFPRGTNVYYFGWQSTDGFVATQLSLALLPTRIAPDGRYSNTLRAVAAYLADFYSIADNSLAQLQIVNHVGPDDPLPLIGGYLRVLCWIWIIRGGGSSSGNPKRYLRMDQRNDGLGVARHPRIGSAGINNPSSVQSGLPRRLGRGNTYL